MSDNTLENVCENMLTHVHKVIHLVVGIFEQGWKSWRSKGGVFYRPDSGHVVTGCWPSDFGHRGRVAQSRSVDRTPARGVIGRAASGSGQR